MGKVIVISGGTDGIGRALAVARATAGDSVVVIGSSVAKGEAAARAVGAPDRVRFVAADLRSVTENERVVADIERHHDRVDALVLCANRQFQDRVLTADGLESTFALYYLSRYLLGHGLRARLAAAQAPVIINVAAPGISAGSVRFDDLRLERRYGPLRAQLQGGRANDLLGVAFAEERSSPARYVLYHPGFTATPGGTASMRQPLRGIVSVLRAIAAKPVADVLPPINDAIDHPPAAALTANDRGRLVDLSRPAFDLVNARRLSAVTRELVGSSPLLP
ncbi:SDR family NAD(P)-dependent oxidoreductase [Actinokineospora globicatena]|nr:SDR family NAD(P)-dependent oxidoreductase [Actinokineospora globicatena]